MKKVISILVALVLLVVAVQPLFALAENGNDNANQSQMLITSEGAVVDTEATSVVDGKAVIKVTLPANNGYVQFNQKLTDLVGGGATVKIATTNNTRAEYEEARFAVQLTADATAATDIVPVDERTVDPGTVGITWSFDGASNVMYVGKGSRTNAAFDQSINNKIVPNNGVGLKFNLNQDGTVVYAYTHNPYNASTPEASTKTLAEIGGTEGVYFRLRNFLGSAFTYVITIESKDIKAPKAEENSIEEFIKISDGSVVDYNASSVVDGTATLKVTLSANGGYVQFNQKLTDLIGGGATVKIATTNNTRAEYEEARFAVQLTADATAATDIVPVDERTVDPGTVGITWSFDGASNIMYVGKGSRTNAAFDQSINNKIVPNNGVGLRFNLNQDGTVVYAPTHNPYNASTPEASTKTLAEIGGTEGVYFRLRNFLGSAFTYVITIVSEDIVAPTIPNPDEPGTNPDPGTQPEPGLKPNPNQPGEEKDSSYNGKFKDYLYVSENGVVDETVTKVVSGKATLKVTVAPGGYFQYLQKITDLIGGTGTVSVVLGDHDEVDYKSADFNLQLTTDADAKTDIIPVDEREYLPDNRAVSFKVLTSGHMWLGSGANTSGGTTYTWEARIFGVNNDCSGGINLKFLKDGNDYVQVRNTRQDLINAGVAGVYTSRQTVENIGADEGVYVRLRNDKTTPVTFTVTINSASVQPLVSPAYKEGNWIFSSEDTTKVSAESKNEKGVFTEKLTAMVAPNGYVQLDKKLAYLIGNSKANVTIQVGNGSVAEYDAARIQVQLTADQKAETDIIPVDERTVDPGVKGMTWLFYGQSGKMWTGRGSTTANGGYYGTTNLISTMHDGIRIAFNYEGDKVAYNTTVGGLVISGTLPSTKTLSEIGGTDGVYFRLRNAATETVKYTVIIQYTEGIVESKPVVQKGWTVKGETDNGVEITDEIDEVLPGFRAWNFTVPENTYAQYNTKITDLKDAAFRLDTAEYDKIGYKVSFAFALDENASWDAKTPDGNLKKFVIFINPSSDPVNVHIAMSTGSIISGKTNSCPTIRTLLTSGTHKGQGGFAISVVEDGGHWYLSVSGMIIKGDSVLEPYLRMDDYVEKGAYFRFYAESNGDTYMYPQVSISSKVVPPIGSDEDESELSEDDKMLKEFLDYFTDNIDALRKADMTVVNKVAEMWNALSYLNQSNVEAYFIDEEEVYNLIQALKSYAAFEPTPDEYEWITSYTTVYTTTTTTHSDAQKKPSKKPSKNNNGGDDFPIEVVIAVAASALVVVAGGVTFFVVRKKRKMKKVVSEQG